MTTAVRSNMWPVIISLWAAVAVAQKQCAVDTDCTHDQYCYKLSMTCVNYTLCGRYNRKESSKPSRDASQCGGCLKGYSIESVVESSEVGDGCKKNLHTPEQKDQSPTATTWVGIYSVIIIIFIFAYPVHAIIRCKRFSNNIPIPQVENPSPPRIENRIRPSAPPASPPIENINNDKYNDTEETNPISTTTRHHQECVIQMDRPLQTRAYRPPSYVVIDPTYDPDAQTIYDEITFPTSDIDNVETSHSSQPIEDTIPEQHLTAIAEEVQNNTTNIALESLANRSPPNDEEGQETRQNGSPGNSEGFSYNNSTGNSHRNSNSGAFIFLRQTVNVINQWNNGR